MPQNFLPIIFAKCLIFLTFAKYMEVKTKAIVLRTVKYGDSRMIVDMLTAHSGRVSFACTLSKTNRGKIKKQLFQPLTILEIDYDERTTTELQRLRDVRMAHPYASLPFDPYKLSIGMFLTEFLLYATRGEHDSEHLEDFTEKSLLWLDNASEGSRQRLGRFRQLPLSVHTSRFAVHRLLSQFGRVQ